MNEEIEKRNSMKRKNCCDVFRRENDETRANEALCELPEKRRKKTMKQERSERERERERERGREQTKKEKNKERKKSEKSKTEDKIKKRTDTKNVRQTDRRRPIEKKVSLVHLQF